MNTKHTPGPWRERAMPGRKTTAWISGGDGNLITEISGARRLPEENAANAALIAAAPEMLAALKNLVNDALANGMHSSEPRIIEARQAIAKAEGK